MKIFSNLFGARAQYLMIKSAYDEEKQKDIKRLGIQSLILPAVGLVGVIVFVVVATLCAQNVVNEPNLPIMSFIGAIVFYAFALVFLLSATLSSITFAVYQRKLNKHKIGLAALIVSLTCLAICVIGTILIIVFML